MEKIKLLKEDITPGEPLPWNVYQVNAKIVLKKGTLIESFLNSPIKLNINSLRLWNIN